MNHPNRRPIINCGLLKIFFTQNKSNDSWHCQHFDNTVYAIISHCVIVQWKPRALAWILTTYCHFSWNIFIEVYIFILSVGRSDACIDWKLELKLYTLYPVVFWVHGTKLLVAIRAFGRKMVRISSGEWTSMREWRNVRFPVGKVRKNWSLKPV